MSESTPHSEHVERLHIALSWVPKAHYPEARDALNGLEEQLEAARKALSTIANWNDDVEAEDCPRLRSIARDALAPLIQEAAIKCEECGALIGWEGAPPNDCLRCGAPFPAPERQDA